MQSFSTVPDSWSGNLKKPVRLGREFDKNWKLATSNHTSVPLTETAT